MRLSDWLKFEMLRSDWFVPQPLPCTTNAILFYLLGWPALIGTCYLLLILVYQGYGSRLAANLRQRVVILADKRVQMINEIIRGIRTIKVCSWEQYFGNSVSEVRGLVKFCHFHLSYFRGLLCLNQKWDN